MSKYIKLEDAINDLDTLWDYTTVDGICSSAVLKQVKTDLQNLPTIEALEEGSKHGKWKNVSGSWDIQEMCDQCGKIVYEPNYNYCPNCGIKMESDWVSVFEKNQRGEMSQNESKENIV